MLGLDGRGRLTAPHRERVMGELTCHQSPDETANVSTCMRTAKFGIDLQSARVPSTDGF